MAVDSIFTLINRGDLTAARAALAPLLRAPRVARDVLLAAAAVETRGGHPRKALALLDRALKAGPDAAVWNAVAIARKAAGDIDGARQAYGAARGLDPANPDLVFNHARLEMDHGDRTEAEALLRQALALRPGPTYARTLAVCLMERGAMAEAVAVLETVQAANDPMLWSYLGVAHQRTGNLAAADTAHARALALAPGHPEILNNAATLRMLDRRLDEAEVLYGRALAVRPDYAEAHYGLGWVRLTRGDFTGGWPEWEWRLKRANFAERKPTAPLWRGERVDGTVLVHAEIGFGDSLNFLSFVRRAAERCRRVVLAVQPALVSLLDGRLDGVTVVDQSKPLPRADRFAYVMSLPGLFVRTFGDIDPQPLLPYATPVRGPRPRVGLCWSTTRARMEIHKIIPSQLFATALKGLDAELVSVQVGLPSEDKAPVVAIARDREAELTDFAATARILAELDAVVTIDSAVAHLAGLMGKPAWVLLHRGADWRWFDGETTPWYQSVRLVRQDVPGDWSAPLAAMRRAISAL